MSFHRFRLFLKCRWSLINGKKNPRKRYPHNTLNFNVIHVIIHNSLWILTDSSHSCIFIWLERDTASYNDWLIGCRLIPHVIIMPSLIIMRVFLQQKTKQKNQPNICPKYRWNIYHCTLMLNHVTVWWRGGGIVAIHWSQQSFLNMKIGYIEILPNFLVEKFSFSSSFGSIYIL